MYMPADDICIIKPSLVFDDRVQQMAMSRLMSAVGGMG